MAKEYGCEYNPETARDLRKREFKFSAYGVDFAFGLLIPEYILGRLNSEILDKLYVHMNEHTAAVVETGIRAGCVHTEEGKKAMARDIGTHLKNYIWECFSITQEQAGQDCWETAPTLQEVPAL